MCHSTLGLADSGADQLVYIIAVAVLFLVGWVIERFKAMMAGSDSRHDPAHRPPPRSASPPLPRPQIPPLRDSGVPRSPRPVPPAVSRPTPPVRPPAPRPAPPVRPGVPVPARPSPQPMAGRTVEERKAVIRGEPAHGVPGVQRPVPKPAPAKPVAVIEEDDEDSPRVKLASGWAERTQSVSVAQSPLGVKTSAKARPQSAMLQSLSRDQLQRAFVLKEILEPPLALRE